MDEFLVDVFGLEVLSLFWLFFRFNVDFLDFETNSAQFDVISCFEFVSLLILNERNSSEAFSPLIEWDLGRFPYVFVVFVLDWADYVPNGVWGQGRMLVSFGF